MGSIVAIVVGLVLLVVGLKLAKEMVKLAVLLGVAAAIIFWFHEDLAVAYSTYVSPYIAGSF
ncbi:MAG: hypothetical protein V1880_02885 [Patescibacteria group bacterium]